MTWCSGLALAADTSLWAAMFFSDLPLLFHHENHREQGRRIWRGLKAGSNSMALRCYLCFSLCWREADEREVNSVELASCFFFSLSSCGGDS